MYRIDNLTAIPYLPTAPPSAAPGFFTDGNPAAALEATVVDAWWLNQLQEEILTVTGAAGIAPDKGRHTQLFEALEALYQRAGVIGNYLPLAGGTLSGFLTLHANPVEELHAATKYYVDHMFGTLDLSGFLPITGGTLYRPGGDDILVMNVDEGHMARMLFNVMNTHMWGVGARSDGNFEIGDWNRGGAVLVIDAEATVTMVGAAFIAGSLTIGGEGGFNALSGQIWNNFRVNGEMSAVGNISSSAQIAAQNAWIGGGGLAVAGSAVVNGELSVGGPFSAPSGDIPGNLVVGGDLHLPSGGNIFAGGGTLFANRAEIGYSLTAGGDIAASGSLRGWAAIVQSDIVAGGSLTSQGAVISGLTHTDRLLTNNDATIGTTLTVSGAATIGGVLRANGNRILSYGGNNPSVAMYNAGAAPGYGMWVGGNPGRMTIGTVDTAGNPLANLVHLDMGGTFNVLGALEVGGGINANGGLNIGGQCHFHSDLRLNGQGTFDGTFRTGSDAIVGNNLVVNGNANVTNQLDVGGRIYSGGDLNVGGYAYVFGTIRISEICHVLMDLFVAGGAAKPGGGVWSDLSDVQLKKDVRDYERGLAEIRRLRPVAYQFNGLGGTRDDGKVYHGLIAQEAAAIMPEMVGEQQVKLHAEDTEDTPVLSLDCTALTFALVNAVRELGDRLDALERRTT